MELIINDEIINDQAIQREIARVRQHDPSVPEKGAWRRAKEGLIRQVLLQQEAQQKILQVDPGEVNERFNRLLADHGGAKYFYKRFNLKPQDEPRVKQDLEEQVKVEKLIDSITEGATKPKEEEMLGRFEERKEHYITEDTVHASHIVKSTNETPAAAIVEELSELRFKLLKDADFAEYADQYSACNDAGGDLGTFARGKMVEEFETVVFSMSPGEISPVFKTQFGYHIAKVFQREKSRQLSFDEARHRIYDELFLERREQLLNSWITKQKKTASIVEKE